MSENSQKKKLTKLAIAALCNEAARSGPNEDNCLVITDLGNAEHTIDVSGRNVDLAPTFVDLKNYGCLLVVADGMGGMNAGEVASDIAIQTIRSYFIDRLENFESTDSEALRLMREAIVAADETIVAESSLDESKCGMGTTVALLWIFDDKAYYAWCGDSRVYLYRENNKEGEGRGDKSLKLQSLTLDHSYVMTSAKKSVFGDEGGLGLTEDEAFIHPMNNVIMRSLGNPSEKAKPDVRGPINIFKDDVFLLCSDGLCGAMRTDKIQTCIDASKNMGAGEILNAIWSSEPDINWHDNMTTLVCQVAFGPENQMLNETMSSYGLQQKKVSSGEKQTSEAVFSSKRKSKKNEKDRSPYTKQIIVGLIAAVVILVGINALLFDRAVKLEPVSTNADIENAVNESADPYESVEYEVDLHDSDPNEDLINQAICLDENQNSVPSQKLPAIGNMYRTQDTTPPSTSSGHANGTSVAVPVSNDYKEDESKPQTPKSLSDKAKENKEKKPIVNN